MFENPRRGKQARNFTTNAPKILHIKSSSEEIFFRKLSLGAPDDNSIQHLFFILHTFFTDHTTFHSHDHRTDNLLKESRHDNSRHITIASLVIIIPLLRHDNNKQITFFSGHTTFHSHDHQTDTLLRESCHDNSRQITIASLATTILSKQHYRV